MTDARERLAEWLRDAYAAEEQAQSLFSRTAKQVDASAGFAQALDQQAARSEQHAQQIKVCLERLDESPSLIKTVTGQVVALAQSISGYVVDDEPVKAVLATATFAHMQIVSFDILDVAAHAATEPGIAEICASIREDKVQFSKWLEGQVADVTRGYLGGLTQG